MSEWWQSDDLVDLHYRNHWSDLYGYDPLDPDAEPASDADYADYEDEIAREKYDQRRDK